MALRAGNVVHVRIDEEVIPVSVWSNAPKPGHYWAIRLDNHGTIMVRPPRPSRGEGVSYYVVVAR